MGADIHYGVSGVVEFVAFTGPRQFGNIIRREWSIADPPYGFTVATWHRATHSKRRFDYIDIAGGGGIDRIDATEVRMLLAREQGALFKAVQTPPEHQPKKVSLE